MSEETIMLFRVSSLMGIGFNSLTELRMKLLISSFIDFLKIRVSDPPLMGFSSTPLIRIKERDSLPLFLIKRLKMLFGVVVVIDARVPMVLISTLLRLFGRF